MKARRLTLGGPSQFERKERLKNIFHVLEDEVGGPSEAIKVEIDPDLDVPVQEVLKDDLYKDKPQEDGRLPFKRKRKVHDENDQTYQSNAKDDSDKEGDLFSCELHKKGESTKEYLLKELRILLERVEVPFNCILPTCSPSTEIASRGHNRPKDSLRENPDSSSKSFEVVCLSSDSSNEQNIISISKETKKRTKFLPSNGKVHSSRKRKDCVHGAATARNKDEESAERGGRRRGRF